MNILVLNSGSSSIKFQLIDMTRRSPLARGLLERIGISGSVLTYYQGDTKHRFEEDTPTHQEGIDRIVRLLTDDRLGVIRDLSDIAAVGHRVVHGGEKYSGTVQITAEVIAAIRECVPLAPLHNPPNIIGIEAARKILPTTPMACTFDTAFHQTMPERAYLYALPYSLYRKYKIRRYGFHGTSHHYVAKEGARQLGRPLAELKVITCHLGNGSSIAAIDGGRSIDTSMGFTPLEGVCMGTRCGDLDPAIVLFLQREEGMSAAAIDAMLNRQSGILGLSEVSSDMRDIEQQFKLGNRQAKLALEIFAYRIKKYIGAYAAAMNGVDLIVFTAGIGERGPQEREMILSGMEYLGIQLDSAANQAAFGKAGVITTPASRVTAMVVPTNEELQIAEETQEIVLALPPSAK